MLNQSQQTIVNLNASLPPRWLLLLMLGLMSAAGLIGSDVYLPALPNMGLVFQQPVKTMQLTLGIYLFGLALGQLIYGPLIDRFGRKYLLLAGMLIYFLASLACAGAGTLNQLLIARFVQALGACSGLIIGRAIVGDLFDAKEAGKIFATIFPFVGMSPAISPLIGGLISFYFGWQATFIFIALFALGVFILVAKNLGETQAINKRQSLKLGHILTAYPRLLMDKQFLAYAAAPCSAYMAYFAYIAQSPYIFHAQGFSERAIGTFYISLSLTYVLGSLSSRRCLQYIALDKAIQYGFMAFNLGALALLLVGAFYPSFILMIAATSILTFGNGFLIPLGTAGAMTHFNQRAGYASGLLGFLQLGIAAFSSSFIGIVSQNHILYLAMYVLFTTVSGFAMFRWGS